MYTINANYNNYCAVDDTSGLIPAQRIEFLEEHPEAYATSLKIQLSTSVPDLYKVVLASYPEKLIRTFPESSQIFIFKDLLITVSIDDRYKPFEKRIRNATVNFFGVAEEIKKSYDLLQEYIPPPSSNVSWYFRTAKGEVTNITVQLKHQDPLKDEFYPWISGGIKRFYSEFLRSDASILLLLGEAGTGKTSLIRDFIHSNELSSALTHDEGLMQSDEFFIEFMTGRNRILVLEDSDVLLHRREDGNSAMSKLLNTSDGLIRTDKKIILSANLTELSSIDSALVRPGRCFSVVRFRPLSVPEASVAAKVIGVPTPSQPSTIAELFNGHREIQHRQKCGFEVKKKS